MKKSLLVTLEFPPDIGGVSKYLKNICTLLPKEKIVVLAPARDDARESDQKREFRIYRQKLLSGLWPRWLGLIGQIRRLAKQEQIELIWVSHVLPVGTAVYFLTRLYRRWPYIVFAHGMDVTVPQQSLIKRFLIKRILRAAFQVVANSDFTRQELLKLGVNESRILKVSPGVKVFDVYDDTRVLSAEMLKKYDLVGKRVLLTVGRLVERKGHDTVIRALPQVLSQFPNLIYVIVGRGPHEAALKALVAKLKLERSVLFTGLVTDKQKIAWHDLSEIFIMTPKRLANDDVEGFGIVYLEANALAKPVIAARSGGVADAVIDGVSGLVVEPDSPQETAQAIIRLLTDSALARRLGEQGQARARAEYAWTVQFEKLKVIL